MRRSRPLRRTPIKRSGGFKRSTPMRQRNPERAAKRRAESFGRQAEACRRMACCVPGCAVVGCDPAHVRSRGAGGKDAANVVPLCRTHHRQQHDLGILTFQQRHGIDLMKIAWSIWEKLDGGC